MMIGQVYDFGHTSTNRLFIVMELLKGCPMDQLLDNRIARCLLLCFCVSVVCTEINSDNGNSFLILCSCVWQRTTFHIPGMHPLDPACPRCSPGSSQPQTDDRRLCVSFLPLSVWRDVSTCESLCRFCVCVYSGPSRSEAGEPLADPEVSRTPGAASPPPCRG